MNQCFLVVDFGTYTATAAVVAAGQTRFINCPPAPGRVLEARYLRGIAADAQRQLQTRIDRLVLTIPSTVPRQGLLGIAAEAGYPDAELLGYAAAAASDPQSRPDLPDGAFVLVCDLGRAWSATLLRLDADNPVLLAEETASESLTREGATESALRWLAASCRAVTARAGVNLAEVATLLVTGASARAAQVPAILRADAFGESLGESAVLAARRESPLAQLGRPMLVPLDPEYAVIRGAARWAVQRQIVSQPASWRIEPLSWNGFPEGSRLLRWTVAEGQTFAHGTCLAQLRSPDDRVFDLVAAREGIMVEQRLNAGAPVIPDAVIAFARSAILIQNDRPTKRLAMKVSGEWTLTQDHQYLVECADSGEYVRMRSIDNGAVVEEVRPNRTPPGNGRVFVQPGGTLALVTWDTAGTFTVWEIPGGRMISEFRAPARPLSVLVNEGQWRLASEVDKQVSVGRYRRDVAMLWDLRTGAVLDEIHGDDLHLRFTGFASRTAEPGFAAEAYSPDGRLRAGSTNRNGQAAIWLHQADSGEELFRADVATAEPVRSAFSGDGHYLLSNWSASDASCLDVWKI